jgi:hypothetical protein
MGIDERVAVVGVGEHWQARNSSGRASTARESAMGKQGCQRASNGGRASTAGKQGHQRASSSDVRASRGKQQ